MTRYWDESVVFPKRPAWVLSIAVTVAAILLWTPSAFSQSSDMKQLMDRLQRLERDIRTLNIQVSRGERAGGTGTASTRAGGPAPTAGIQPEYQQSVARMELRLTALAGELRSATGRAEEVTHQLDQISLRLDKLIGDVDYRLGVLEKNQAAMRAGQSAAPGGPPPIAAVPPPAPVERAGMPGGSFASQPGVLGTISREDMEKIERQGAGQGAAQTQAGAPAPAQDSALAAAATTAPTAAPAQQAAAVPGVLPEGSPKEQYTYAFGMLRQTKYDDAEVAFSAFLKAHGNHALATNARYWLGETFYVRGDYVRAAEAFLEGYQGNPKGQKAPDILLKLGMSLANLDKKREACAAFGKLAEDYADASASIKRLVGREQTKNACE
ncbi:MAG: tol-pal system protein YbgF [Rhodospirillales bacterium]|nr:tol-pal system protein YbgF [Rhodospirillales bacterium]